MIVRVRIWNITIVGVRKRITKLVEVWIGNIKIIGMRTKYITIVGVRIRSIPIVGIRTSNNLIAARISNMTIVGVS